MNKVICPGQDTRFWRPGDIFDVECGYCGNKVEFFKDESRRRCPKCGTMIVNPRLSLGCAQWCEHARECLGFDPKDMHDNDSEEVALVDRLIEEMKKVFGDDQRRITHALMVLERAQEILRGEKADPRVVLAAAVLHDIGIREAEKRHGSSAPGYQELEGPPIAERIMKDLGLDPATIEHVTRIVGSHHSAKDIDTPEFRIIWDADRLVNLSDERREARGDSAWEKTGSKFRTRTGKDIADRVFLEKKD